MFRIEPYRLVIIGNGLILLALVEEPGVAAVEVGFEKSGIEPYGLTEVSNGPIMLALFVQAPPRW